MVPMLKTTTVCVASTVVCVAWTLGNGLLAGLAAKNGPVTTTGITLVGSDGSKYGEIMPQEHGCIMWLGQGDQQAFTVRIDETVCLVEIGRPMPEVHESGSVIQWKPFVMSSGGGSPGITLNYGGNCTVINAKGVTVAGK